MSLGNGGSNTSWGTEHNSPAQHLSRIAALYKTLLISVSGTKTGRKLRLRVFERFFFFIRVGLTTIGGISLMKNRVYFFVVVFVLFSSLLLSARSSKAFVAGDPIPPCGPAGCPLPPVSK
jgi:hypothetical protein